MKKKGNKHVITKKRDVKQDTDKQKHDSQKSISQKNAPVRYTFIALTCALILLPVFFRGLFFERELRVAHIAAFILVISWTVLTYKDRQLPIIRHKYEYFLLAAVAMYFVTVPFAASHRMALLEALKYVNYLAVYILVRDHVIKDKKAVEVFMNTILASVFAMCLIGLMNYIGLTETRGALTGGRISSTLQYPNTLAAVIGAAVFLNMYLIAETEKLYIKSAYTAVLNILLVTFILTFSRTMYIMFPLLLVVFMALVPSKLQGNLFAAVFASVVPAVAAAILIMKYSDTNSSASVIILLISVLLSWTMAYFIQRTNRLFVSTRVYKYIFAGLLLVVVAAGAVLLTATQPLELAHYDTDDGNISRTKTVYSVEDKGDYILVLDVAAHQTEEKSWLGRIAINSVDRAYNSKRIKNYYLRQETDGTVEIPFSTDSDTYYITISLYNYYNGTSFTIRAADIINGADGEKVAGIKLNYKYLPDNLASRIESLNLKNRSFQGRIAFFRDAFSIIKDNFLMGLGGGAWEAAYMKYRSYAYWTTQTHSYPIQVWMEIGTLGLLLVLGFAAYYAINVVKAYKNMDNEKDKLQLIAIASFILAILFHSLVDFDLSLGAVSILLWASFALAVTHFPASERLSDKTDVYIKSVFSASLVILLGLISCMGAAEHYNRQIIKSVASKEYEEAEKNAVTAVKLDPLNSAYRTNLINIINLLDIDRGQKYMRINEQLQQAIRHDPFDYELHSRMSLHQFQSLRFDEASQLVDSAIANNPAIPETYMQKMNFLYNISKYYHEQENFAEAADALGRLKRVKGEMVKKNKGLRMPIEVDPGLLSHYYMSGYVLDNIDHENVFDQAYNIVMYEDFTFDSDGDLLPDLWQIPYQDDKIVEGCIHKEDEAAAFVLTSDSPSFYIQRMDMGFEPSSRYLLAVSGYVKSPEGKMRVMVRSGSGTAEQFRDGYFVFNEEAGTYQTVFETTDDIEKGNQYIRLYFNDVEDQVLLKQITIIKID